ncbi:MAG: peptide chain release factor 3 [Gammaproteobacteria bacterium]|jgi:peptide chain release factor 3
MSTSKEIEKRRTFAIISHPDAGKTTITEKLLLFGGAINTAGAVKARKSQRHATSDWMEIEQQRGISVTSSVMQFEYADCVINLLDTPGHEDFSEDTYRTLTAVDSALMVIDAAKGVEDRTIKLLEICRLRKTPVITLINKMDRFARDSLELIDEIEQVLDIQCAPISWPLGSGQHFAGIYHRVDDRLIPFHRETSSSKASTKDAGYRRDDPEAAAHFGNDGLATLAEEMELIDGAGNDFDITAYREGNQTPVFFGSALRSFGIQELLDFFVSIAPPPQPRLTDAGRIDPDCGSFSGFVFKIQANMDPQHRDRIAFLRICSGQFEQGMKLHHVRTRRDMPIANALTFMARGREHTQQAWAGDIIGIHNHGTVQIGDTFTVGESMTFQGVPSFAPELFRRVRSRDPLRGKALLKGLTELGEEGAAQVFRLTQRNELVIGAIGVLQFDVVSWRLKHEYNVDCIFEAAPYQTARWVSCEERAMLEKFRRQLADYVALDGGDFIAYMAPSMVNLQLTEERWPDISFHKTRELSANSQLAKAN